MDEKREWRVKLGIDHYWITTAEKDYFLKAINSGQELVVLRGGKLILSKSIIEIVHKDEIVAAQMLDKGYRQCEHGNWIPERATCGSHADSRPVLEYKFDDESKTVLPIYDGE